MSQDAPSPPQQPSPAAAEPSPASVPAAPKAAPESFSSSGSANKWRLPDGIEDHIEAGLIKTAVGAAVGGLVGLALFRSGGGYRSASVAAGIGIGLGSTYERVVAPVPATSHLVRRPTST